MRYKISFEREYNLFQSESTRPSGISSKKLSEILLVHLTSVSFLIHFIADES